MNSSGEEFACQCHEPQEMWVLSLGWEDCLQEEVEILLMPSCLEDPMGRGAWREYKSTGLEKADTAEHTHACMSSVVDAVD